MKLEMDKKICTCGKTHMTTVDDVVVGHGVIDSIPTLLRKYNNTDKT